MADIRDRFSLLDLGKPKPPPMPVAPRGRPMSARTIVKTFYTEPDGHAVVTERWVRDNMPYKITASYNRVMWYDCDVVRLIEAARKLGIPIKDVKLHDLEGTAA